MARLQICFTLDTELEQMIQEYKKSNNIPSISKTIEQLIMLGLNTKPTTMREKLVSVINDLKVIGKYYDSNLRQYDNPIVSSQDNKGIDSQYEDYHEKI